MIKTFDQNTAQQLITSASALTGLFLRHVDLFTIWTQGNQLCIETELKTNGVVTGAANLVLNYAFSSKQSHSAAELVLAKAQETYAIPQALNERRVLLAPEIWIGARWLHVWYDHDAIAAGSTLELTTYVNGLTNE